MAESATGSASRQALALAILITLYAIAAVTYVVVPGGAMSMARLLPATETSLTQLQIALGTSAIILVAYGGLGFLGLQLARRLGLPGIYRPDAGMRPLLVAPLGLGVVAGVVLIGLDQLFRTSSGFEGFPHPPFPASLLASISAGIGEEVMFRLFLMTLWLGILLWVGRRLRLQGPWRHRAVWTANLIAALAFAAGHLGSAMVLYAASSPLHLPPTVLVALLVMNGSLGVLAGWQFVRTGLIAAAGVHFWADVVWHVVYGAL